MFLGEQKRKRLTTEDTGSTKIRSARMKETGVVGVGSDLWSCGDGWGEVAAYGFGHAEFMTSVWTTAIR